MILFCVGQSDALKVKLTTYSVNHPYVYLSIDVTAHGFDKIALHELGPPNLICIRFVHLNSSETVVLWDFQQRMTFWLSYHDDNKKWFADLTSIFNIRFTSFLHNCGVALTLQTDKLEVPRKFIANWSIRLSVSQAQIVL